MAATEFLSLDLATNSPWTRQAAEIYYAQLSIAPQIGELELASLRARTMNFYGLARGTELVAIGSLLLDRSSNLAEIEALAVAQKYQWQEGGVRFGFGTDMIHRLETVIARAGITYVRVHPVLASSGFYAKRGYDEDTTCALRYMTKRLSLSREW